MNPVTREAISHIRRHPGYAHTPGQLYFAVTGVMATKDAPVVKDFWADLMRCAKNLNGISVNYVSATCEGRKTPIV